MPSELLYLDHAAATPIDQRVLEAMLPYYSEQFYNPSSPYAPALTVRRAYEQAKATIAQSIGAKPDELTMTAGATESINLAFGSVSGHVVTTAIEHDAVLQVALRRNHTIVDVDERGSVSAADVARAVTPETSLVSVALANNELGTIQQLRDVAEVIQRERELRLSRGNLTPIYLHSDASQGVGQIDVQVARLGVDLLTVSAAKLYGPKQVGLLWAARSIVITPTIVGGGQERGLRSGTENVAGVVGFARAIELATKHRKSEAERLSALRGELQQRLVDAFPRAIVSGNQKRRLPGHLHISFDGIDAERLVFRLETRGVLVATGSACAANKGTRSHVLVAIGMPSSVADGSLRLTLGKLSTEQTVRVAAEIIIEEVGREYARIGGTS